MFADFRIVKSFVEEKTSSLIVEKFLQLKIAVHL